MNQKSMLTTLRSFTSSDHPYGNSEGKEVLRKLSEFVALNVSCKVFGISLEGITATDASFPRESVVTLAKQLRGEKGFYLTNLVDRDLIDNWSYAALAKDQPLVIWNESGFEVIGPELNRSTRDLVEFVLQRGSVLASHVASELGLSVQNASTRLKSLVSQGYLLRSEDVAETGGIEFKYSAIK
jgi:hypothetical protein